MSLRTRIKLWKLKRAMGPSMVFKSSLRKDLNTAWDAKFDNKSPWYQLGMRHAVAGFTAITLLLTSGGGVYAYNNPEVTEGSPLYPIKKAIETVEEVTKKTPEAKAKFYLKKIERREAEQQVLERKNPLSKIKKEIKEISNVESDIKINVSSTSDLDVKEEAEEKEKNKIEVTKRKIKRTQKAIEKTEKELEKTRQIIERKESKDIKLREELKKRAERRLEERKKQLEIKIEIKKERRENSEEVRRGRGNNDRNDNDKIETNNTTELRTRQIKELINF